MLAILMGISKPQGSEKLGPVLHCGYKQVNSSVLFLARHSGVLYCAVMHCTCFVQWCHVCSAVVVRELPADSTAAPIRAGVMICQRARCPGVRRI